LLDHITDDFQRRLAVRRRMLGHLGLDFTDDEARCLRDDLRQTLLACARCGNPDICEGWVSQNRPGMPMFCRARDAFLRLEAASAAPEPARLRA
jgi:hypothetical protein